MSKERSGLRIGMACRLTEKQEEAPGAMSKERSGLRIGMACRLTEKQEEAPGAMSKERSGLRIGMACRLCGLRGIEITEYFKLYGGYRKGEPPYFCTDRTDAYAVS